MQEDRERWTFHHEPTLNRYSIRTGFAGEETIASSYDTRHETMMRFKLMTAAPQLRDDLQALVDWCRSYTSPRDPNSPHDILVQAVETLKTATPGYDPITAPPVETETLAALRLAFEFIGKHSPGNPYMTEPGRTVATAIQRLSDHW
jgi:hypothetical protein